MPILEFPDVEASDEQGLLALGGDLHHDSLMLAYKNGIFPWPISKEYPLAWFSPIERGIIRTKDIKIRKSLKKFCNNSDWSITFNTDFSDVIRFCQETHGMSSEGTWITDQIIEGYENFFNKGHAYSVEVRNTDGDLVGGLYGVSIGTFFSGESMFYFDDNASKVALLAILRVLESHGVEYLDIQMVTETTRAFGGSELPRADFINSLKALTDKENLELPKSPIRVESLTKELSL